MAIIQVFQTANRLQAIAALAQQYGVEGLCGQWTCDWLRRMLNGQGVVAGTYNDLNEVAGLQKWFAWRVNKLADEEGLDSIALGTGLVFNPNPVANGRLSAINAADVDQLPNGGYYISMWGANARHGVGMHYGAGVWSTFDQNKGMRSVIPPPPRKTGLLRLTLSGYDAVPQLSQWEIYAVTLKPLATKDDLPEKPKLLRKHSF